MQPRDLVFEMYESLCEHSGYEVGERYLACQRDPKSFAKKFPLLKEGSKNLQKAAIALNGTNPSRKAICVKAGYFESYFSRLSPAKKIHIAELAGITLRPKELLPQSERREKNRLLFLATAREWAELGKPLRFTSLSEACGVSRSHLSKSSKDLRQEIIQIFKESSR